MKPVVFHRDAEAELDGAIAWYEGKQAGLGLDLKTKIEAAIALIEANPTRQLKHNDKGFRKCRVERFPYTIYFLELDEVIWIAAVAHDKRKPDYWMAREPED